MISFHLNYFFINDQNYPRITELINEEKALIKAQLKHLYARKKLIFNAPKAIKTNYGHYLILTRAISRNEGQLDWVNSPLIKIGGL